MWHWLATNKEWVFSGIGVLALSTLGATAVLVWRWWKRRRARSSSPYLTAEQIKRYSRRAEPAPPPAPRIFIQDSVDQIVSVCENKTAIQAKALIDTMYTGKWLEVDLPVGNVDESLGLVVSFRRPDGKWAPVVTAAFEPRWRDHLTHVAVGARLKIVGKIIEVSPSGILLDEAAVVDAQASPARAG